MSEQEEENIPTQEELKELSDLRMKAKALVERHNRNLKLSQQDNKEKRLILKEE